MSTCNNGHEVIQHISNICPLCITLERLEEIYSMLGDTRKLLWDVEEQLKRLDGAR